MTGQSYLKLIKKPFSLLSALTILAIVMAACAPVASSNTTAPDTIDVATSPTLGKILVDGKGMTLYIFTKDTPDQSNCDATCLANWPALVSSGTPKLGPGVDAALIGTATLSGGQKIITYNHLPLYTFIKDTQPGQTSGEDVGSVWYVVSPDGKPVIPASTSSASPAATQAPSVSEAAIDVASSATLGKYLVDGEGMTLYVFSKDGPNQSNCTGTCLTKWPPLLTNGNPSAGAGIVADGIGSAKLSDGSMIVTYYGMPLYTYSGDTAAGQTNGEGIGGFWFAVAPDGMLIQPPASTTPTATPTTAPTAAMTEPTVMVATDPKLGSILVDGNGMSLYAFTKDGPDKSNCNAGCLANWPPLLTQGKPVAGTGADDSLIGSATLADGSLIVTYNHMPLYHFIKDTKPGDIAGQGVGGVWFVVSPDGKIVNQ